MSQHDLDIANASGSGVRADLNLAFVALGTWSSGASAPSTMHPRMRWVDTTNGVIKRRNAANSAWIVESTDDETRVLARSTNTILDVSDFGKTFVVTSTFTQTFDAAATLGDGWYVQYINDGSGIITLDPNGAETIDGAVTIDLHTGESCEIWCTGAVFRTIARGVPSIAVGSFTRDLTLATSNQAITGLGFMPQEVEFFATAAGQPGATSWGFDLRFAAVVMYDDYVTTANTYNSNPTNSILLETAIGSYQAASVLTFDVGGFTLSWTKTGTPSGTATIVYRVRRR